MNYATLLPTDTPVRTGLIGAGAFDLSFYRQSQRMPGLTIAAVCDLIPSAARRRLVQAGTDPEAVQVCESAAAAQQAMAKNRLPVVPDGGRPRTGRGTRSMAVRRPGATKASGRACGPICRPSRICPPCGWTARSCARTGVRRARPQRKRRSPRGAAVGAASAPRSPSWRINGAVPCACA